MSGSKTTYTRLKDTEYDHLMNNARRQDNLERKTRQRLDEQKQHLEREFNQQLSNMQNRHQRLENSLFSMDSKMQRQQAQHHQHIHQVKQNFHIQLTSQEEKHIAQLNTQSRQFHSALQKQGKKHEKMIHKQAKQFNRALDNQRSEYTTMIQKQSQAFNTALEQQRQQLQSQITHINNYLQQKEQDEQQRAQSWQQQNQKLLSIIQSEYRHQTFAPDAVARLQNELNLIEVNMQHGDYQAAISTYQQSYLRLSELQLELEYKQAEWEYYFNAAQCSLATTLALCEANQTAEYIFDVENNSEAIEFEVDYWTEGQLTQLQQKLQQTQQDLQHNKEEHSIKNLQTFLQQSEQNREQIHKLVAQAQSAILASQLRFDLSDMIEESLQGAGWEIIDETYEGEDQRRAMHIKLENPAGDQLVTIITPENTQDQGIQNRLDLSFFDQSSLESNSPEKRLQHITTLLNNNDIETTPPICERGTEHLSQSPHREHLDFEQVRSKKTQEQQ